MKEPNQTTEAGEVHSQCTANQTDHDDLAALVLNYGWDTDIWSADEIADAIMAAGWSKRRSDDRPV